ncbi:hypothetical protein BC831DRAFT_460504 [Entophlyctis helioformis]|nr:hypothetical protein BC831DRAFT_460504 [Entophlyctis helioformis]
MRVNNTCESCIRKKRKCSRDKPSCQQCLLSGIKCTYQAFRPSGGSGSNGDAHSNHLETTSNSSGSGSDHSPSMLDHPHSHPQAAVHSYQQGQQGLQSLQDPQDQQDNPRSIHTEQQQQHQQHQQQEDQHMWSSTATGADFAFAAAPITQAHAQPLDPSLLPYPPLPSQLHTATAARRLLVDVAEAQRQQREREQQQRDQDDADLLGLFSLCIGPHLLLVPDPYLSGMLRKSMLAMHSIRAFTCAIAPATTSKTAMDARAHYEKAITLIGDALLNPSPGSVIGLLMLAMASTQLSTAQQGSQFMELGVQLAIRIGLNTEDGIAALASSGEYEKDTLRALFWSMLQFEVFLVVGFELPIHIQDKDMLVGFPSDMYASKRAHPLDSNLKMEIAAMSCTNWAVPSLPNRGTLANLLIIEKITIKVALLNAQIKAGKLDELEALRARVALDSSLRAWYGALPPSIKSHHVNFMVAASTPMGVDAWRPLFAMSLYNFARILLWRNVFVENVLSSPEQATTSHAFMECIQAANDMASTVVLAIVKHNAYMIVNPFLASMTLVHGLVLQTALKLPASANETIHNATSLSMLKQCLHGLSTNWKTGCIELDILQYLESLPDAASIVRLFEFLTHTKRLHKRPRIDFAEDWTSGKSPDVDMSTATAAGARLAAVAETMSSIKNPAAQAQQQQQQQQQQKQQSFQSSAFGHSTVTPLGNSPDFNSPSGQHSPSDRLSVSDTSTSLSSMIGGGNSNLFATVASAMPANSYVSIGIPTPPLPFGSPADGSAMSSSGVSDQALASLLDVELNSGLGGYSSDIRAPSSDLIAGLFS